MYRVFAVRGGCCCRSPSGFEADTVQRHTGAGRDRPTTAGRAPRPWRGSRGPRSCVCARTGGRWGLVSGPQGQGQEGDSWLLAAAPWWLLLRAKFSRSYCIILDGFLMKGGQVIHHFEIISLKMYPSD